METPGRQQTLFEFFIYDTTRNIDQAYRALPEAPMKRNSVTRFVLNCRQNVPLSFV